MRRLRIVTLGILSVWATLANPASVWSSATKQEIPRIEQWMGVYLGGKKIGYSFLARQSVDPRDPLFEKGLRCRFSETLTIQGIQTESEALLREDDSLGRFRFHFRGAAPAGSDLVCSGQVQGSTLIIEVESAGTVTRRELALPEPCFLASAAHFCAARRGLVPGTEFTCLAFDPMAQTLGPLSFKIGARATREALGNCWEATEVKMTYLGVEQTSWITDSGLRLRDEALGTTMVAEMETAEQAKQIAAASEAKSSLSDFMFEIAEQLKVKLEGEIPDPRKCLALTLEVSGITPEDLVIDDYWQRVVGQPTQPGEKFQVQIRHQLGTAHIAAATALLEPGFLVQSDAPTIRNEAEKLTKGSATNQEKARKLCEWVYNNIDRSSLRLTIPSAVEVLKSRKGDCNEHATLFAALARAAGVPTKICAGVMYAQGAFFYHAWNEVYLEEQGWIPLDTTLNQIPADATHLKLAEGDLDQQVGLLKAVGKLQLKVVSLESGE